MKIAFSLFLIVFSCLWNAQTVQISLEPKLAENIHRLDQLMENNDEKVLTLLCPDVSFGHSNGWVQNFEDFKKDFNSKKVMYSNIQQIEIYEAKKYNDVYSVRRKIKVSGIYKNQDFEMMLGLLEIWKKEKSFWKLWSRQSIEIKP
ncbi:nuclear transport factor 2 family protein [Chryseobacterium sp.]|uniref:nuclear transport factor 2 family protein n=1 Tax=Chryseobacterium sp. TaxID=1871047 RepID=UPI00289FC949|nr:nuclear transport factor 2 family protein [Chryseobacterium sp.]